MLTEMTKLNLPNLVDSGEGDTSKLKLITARFVHVCIHVCESALIPSALCPGQLATRGAD